MSELSKQGRQKIDWVKNYMPVLKGLEEEFSSEKPFSGKKLMLCIHLEAKTAYLCEVLKNCGAEVIACGCNPLSTQDDIVAALKDAGIKVFARHGCSMEEYYEFLDMGLSCMPDLILDDGGDTTEMLHEKRRDVLKNVKGASEETTTGVHRLRQMQKQGKIEIPIIPVNDAECKYLFDNRYGTGQSAWDGIMRTTNLIIAGKNVVIAGYGWCGKGAAKKAQGLGAKVIITEIDPRKAAEAVMDGFSVMPMDKAAEIGDIFLTLTGCEDVITKKHFEKMKSGVLLANAGHFDCEINKNDLNELAVETKEMRKNVLGYVMEDGRILNLLAEGRLVNLASGDGHPAEIMDMSFALQFFALKYLNDNIGNMKAGIMDMPKELDDLVAQKKLKAMGVEIDILTEAQRKYLFGE